MIKNVEQFKQYFYLWLCKECFEDINFNVLEKHLKNYLMVHGFSLPKYKDTDVCKNLLVGAFKCYDLDELKLFYLKYGFLRESEI